MLGFDWLVISLVPGKEMTEENQVTEKGTLYDLENKYNAFVRLRYFKRK